MPSGSAPRIVVVQDAVLTKRQTERILCNCSQCNGTKLTPARFENYTGSRRKSWKLIVKVKGNYIKLENLLTGKKPGVAKITQSNAPIPMKQKVEELLQEQYTPVHARSTTEMCAICRWIEDWDYNNIIICNRCQVAVHQECYGARDVNDLSSWVCRAYEEPQVKRNCCLCPIKGGALKRTDVGDFWVHVTSTWFQPKMTFLDPDGMEPAVGVLSVPLDSFKKKCVICEQVHGACTKCCKCNSYYHAMCASRAGDRMKLHTYMSHGKQISCFDSYCPNHGDVNKSNALVVCTEEIVFSSMRSQRNNARPSCSRLVKRDTENQSTSCPETDLASTSSDKACARCRVYRKTNRKIISIAVSEFGAVLVMLERRAIEMLERRAIERRTKIVISLESVRSLYLTQPEKETQRGSSITRVSLTAMQGL